MPNFHGLSPAGPRRLAFRLRSPADRPSACRWHPPLTVVAAAVLAIERLVFIWVHLK